MSHVLVSELLVNAFSEGVLVDIEQDNTLPPIPDDDFLLLIDGPLLDYRASFLSQKTLILNELKGRYLLPPRLFNFCYFIDLLFDCIEHQSDLDIKIFETLQTIKPLFVRLLIKDPRFVQSSQHYLRQFMDEHFRYLMGWESSLGELGQTMLSIWKKSVSALNLLQGTEEELSKEIKDSFSELDRFIEKTDKNEEKNRTKEISRRKNQQKEREVDIFLDEKMEEKKLPPSIIQFLASEWRSSLLAFHKREFLVDYNWEMLCEFTVDMIENFSVNSTCNKLTLISEMKPKLDIYLAINDEGKHRIFSMIDKLNVRILNNDNIDAVFATPLLEENKTKKLNMSASVIEVTKKLKLGQWVYFQNKNKKLKIADIYEDPNDFLFVDILGNKIETKHQRLLAYDIVSKQARLITSKRPFNKFFIHALEGYFQLYKTKCKEGSARKQQLALDEEEKRQKALNKAQNEAKNLKKQKALAELKHMQEAEYFRKHQLDLKNKVVNELEEKHAQYTQKILMENEKEKAEFEAKYEKETEKIRIEKEKDKVEVEKKLTQEVESLRKIKLETEETSQRELRTLLEEKEKLERELKEKSDENRRYKMIDQVKALTIGSWLSIPKLDNTMVEGKIAIIYPSTGKYVFVDSSGIRIRDLTEEEIVGLMLDNKTYILKQENSFDSSMQEVIKSLRK